MEPAMSARAYILLDVVDDKSHWVAEVLRSRVGVVIAEPLEGPPDVMVVVEASDRQKLAELTIQILDSVEAVTRGLRLLPAQAGFYERTYLKPSAGEKK
jgi:hypothetical protein